VHNDGKGSADAWINDIIALTENAPLASKGKINAKYDAELKATEQQPKSNQSEIDKKADILQKKKERLANVKPMYHHTNVDTKDFNFNNFQRGNKQVSQFGDGLNASSNTTSFLVSRYGKPIQGEVNDADFVKIDASKTEKEVYEELKKQGYIFSEVHDTNDVLSEVPGAAMELFTDFQKSNPNVKGVRVSNHIIGNTKVAPFYVIYDAKSFYGQGALSKKIEQESNAELAALESKPKINLEAKKADIERRRQEELDNYSNKDQILREWYQKNRDSGNKIATINGKKYYIHKANIKTIWYANEERGEDFKGEPWSEKDAYKFEEFNTLDYRNANTSLSNRINAKYDAELKALEEMQQENKVEQPIQESTEAEEIQKAFESMTDAKDNSTLVQDSNKKVKKNFDFGGEESFIKSSTKLPIIQSTLVTQTDIDNVKKIFGDNVNIQNLANVANSDAWATFTQSAVTLFRGATRADLYHEAWHHFSQLYLTIDEKKRLYNETRERVKDLKDKSDLEVEEYIAREFSKFTETGKIEGKFPERKSIFQKIIDFLKKVFSKEKDLSFDTLFNQLYKGQVNPLAYSTNNLMFGKLNSSNISNFSFNETKTIEYGLDALLIQAMASKDISSSQLNKVNINAVYNAVGKYLNSQYQSSDNSVISDNLEKLLENWNEVKKYHLNNSVIFTGIADNFEIDEEGNIGIKQQDEDDIQGRNKADYNEASEKSVFDILDKEVKSLIFTLVDKDKNGNEKLDPNFGLPKLVDYPKYVNILSEAFANKQDFLEITVELKRLAKDYPAMQDLLDLLTINDSAELKLLRIKFMQLALVKKPINIDLYRHEDGMMITQKAVSNKKTTVENDLKNYFLTVKPTENSFFTNVNEEGNSIKKEIILPNNMNYSEREEFLTNLGVDTSFLQFMTDNEKKEFYDEAKLFYTIEHLNGYLKKYGEIKDIYTAVKTEINKNTQSSFYNAILEAHLKYNPVHVTGARLNANGKIENELVLPSTLDKVVITLSKVESIQELIKNPNFVYYQGFFNSDNYLDLQHSKLLQYLFNPDGTRNKKATIEVANQNGLNSTDEAFSGLKTKDLYYKEKAIADINRLINSKLYSTMQLSNKASYINIELGKILIQGDSEFDNTMLGYLMDELKIIKEFDKGNKDLTKLTKLSAAIGKKGNYNFAIFKEILSPELSKKVIDAYIKDNILTDSLISEVNKEIKEFFRKETSLTVDFLGGEEIVKIKKIERAVNEIVGSDPELLIEQYIKNQFVFNVEMSKLIFGNPYMHKDPYKRIAGATSTGVPIRSDKYSLADYKSITYVTQRTMVMDHLVKDRLGLETIEFKNKRNGDNELRFNVFADKKLKAETFDSIMQEYNRVKSTLNPKSIEYKALLKKEEATKKAYSDVNASDAMGAITMDAWRKFNWLAGRWSPELENIYNKTVLWDYYNRLFKQNKDTSKELEYFTKRNEYVLSEKELTAIAVMKYQYYGNVKNSSIMEKGFHKYQLMPLIPQLIDGKNWEHHLDRMLLEDVDYVLFDSADKLEKEDIRDPFYNAKGSVDTIEELRLKYKEGKNTYNIKTGYLENLKEQVFMENGTDDSLLFGTQVRALLFNTNDFSDLYDEFRDVIQTLTNIEKEKLFKASGLNESGEISDNSKFIKFLLDEIDKKVVNTNVKEYLRLTNANELPYSLDTGIQRQPIESIVNSVIQNKLVKQKMHGEMMVQVSNVGFEDYGTTNSLKFYDLETTKNGTKVRKMEVKIPLSGKFKNLLNIVIDGQKVETRERLNQLIREGKIDQRSLTMVGYRIPTQEHNSMEIMIVQEFLDPISNLVVVPYEITAKAGSDFDIDKLNIFKPHISKSGKYIESKEKRQDKLLTFIEQKLNNYENYLNDEKITNTQAEEKIINDIFDTLSSINYTPEEIEEIKLELQLSGIKNKEELKDQLETLTNTKDFYQNRIIEIFDKVLLDPKNFLNLITPNSTFMFDEGINDVFKNKYSENDYVEKDDKLMPKDIKYTNSLLPRYNWITYKNLMDAGKGLGIAAVGNKFSQLIQKAKVNFTEEYIDNYKLLIPIENISNRNLQDGQSKATAYSQLINLLVDVANDPRVGYANMSDEVIPIVNLMINFGIPIQTIMHFINQPIIVDYVAWSAKNEKSIMKPKYVASNFNDYLKLYKDKITGFNLDDYNTSTINEAVDLLQDETIEFNIAPTNMQYNFKSILDNDKLVKEQLLVLTQFIQMQDMANDFLALQMTMNFDTRLTKDGFEAYQKQKSFREIKKANIFENLDVLKEKTIIAPLNSMDLMVKVNKTLLPLANDEALYAFLSNKLETSFQKKGQAFKTKFIRTFKNDFISFLFQNFIGKTEQSLELFNERFAPVLKTENQDFTSKPNAFGLHLIKNLFKDFAKLRNEQPEIFKENSILERMFVFSEEDFRNIGLSYFNKDSDLQDSFIEQFKELLLHSNLDIRNFMLKFAYMSFYQSGLNKSFISSSDIIPVDIISPMLENVRNQYMKDVNSTQKKLSLLDAYFNLFMENNNAFRSYDRNNPDNKKAKTNKSKVASNRVKLYSMPITKLDNITKETNIPSTEVENGIYSQLGNKTQSENVVIDEVNGRKPAVESNLPIKDVKINIYAGDNQNTELSNFAIRPFKTNVETSSGNKEYTFQSVEQGFHFYKTVVANNPQVAAQILKTTNGGTLRNLTSRSNLNMTSEQVKEWDDTSKSIMLNLMYDSYAQNPDKAQLLLNTGDATITHTQDNTRWKTDFPEVVMTVRDMLREEGFDKNQSSKPIVAYRTRGNNFLEALEKDNAIGNPWNSRGYGLYKTNTVKEAVQEFISWMTGEKHIDKLQDYRQVIIDKIPELKGKQILYYKELGEPSHATALDYLINKYNWNQNVNTEVNNSKVEAKDFTNHSGGAEGSDIQWDKTGKEFGFINNKHYWTETKTPHGNTEITKEDFEEGRYESAKAAKRNFGYQYSAMKDSRLIRNWSQVKHSDAIFAIGKIVNIGEKIFPNQKSDTRIATNPSVTGGTGYAVGMGINNNRPVYVFNQSKSDKYDIGWYKWDNNSNNFIKTEIPTLTKEFAGIGTREINDAGKQAIRDVYEKTLQNVSNQSTENEFTPKDLGLNTDSNQNDAVCK
jgi:predicted NAD-dependent protein-ADP-ribosyltransferase YbiA (DUF1768 family)